MKYWQWLIAGAAVVVVIILLISDFNPSGVRTFTSWASIGNAAIRPLVPENRVVVESSQQAKVTAEPVYLDVRLPQKYAWLDLELNINNPIIPLLQAGLKVVGTGDWNYYLQTLQHRQLDQLPWPKLEQDGLTLWQKYPKYKTIAEFLADINNGARIATFNYELKRDFYLPNYHDPKQPLVINRALRGPLQMAVYVAPSSSDNQFGDLNITFKIQDINRTVGPDPVSIFVSDQSGRRLYSDLLPDDGLVGDRVGASAARELKVLMPHLKAGAYFIELRANQDIFTRRITSAQHKIVFREQLYPADNAEYADGFLDLNYSPTTLVTNGRQFSFRTAHPKGYQTIYLNGQPAATLQVRHQESYATTTTPLTTIRLPLGDVQIATDGWLAFSHDQFFDPLVYTVDEFPQLTAFDYLLARYTPQAADGWHMVKASFALDNAAVSQGRIRLLISGSQPTEADGQLQIGQVKITLHKPPLTFNNAVNLFKRWIISWIKR